MVMVDLELVCIRWIKIIRSGWWRWKVKKASSLGGGGGLGGLGSGTGDGGIPGGDGQL